MVTNPNTHVKIRDGHKQYNYKLQSETDYLEFELYTRQNLREGMEDDFSCGISWLALFHYELLFLWSLIDYFYSWFLF